MTQPTAETIEELLAITAGRLEDLAEEAGVSYSALYSWATGRRRPSRRNLNRLAELAEDRSERLAELAEKLGADRPARASEGASEVASEETSAGVPGQASEEASAGASAGGSAPTSVPGD